MAFAGKIYFTGSGGSMIRCYDTGTRTQTVVTERDPRFYPTPDGTYPRLGANTILFDGTVVNQGWFGEVDPSNPPGPGYNYMVAKIFAADLTGPLLGQKNFPYQYTSPVGYVVDSATLDTIIRDEEEQAYWTRHSLVADGSALWAVTELNANLDVVRHVGDVTTLTPFNSGYTGSSSVGANADLLGRWLYHNLTFADGIGRINVTTGEWHAILNSNQDHNGTACILLGVDEVNGHYITLNVTGTWHPEYVGHQYWVQVRDPASATDPWWDLAGGHIPSGWANIIGPPLAEYGYDGITWPYSPYIEAYYPNPVVISGGRMYFMVDGIWDETYGDNDDGTGWGYDIAMWSMDLSNGTVQLEAEIPYGYFNSAGEPTTYNDSDYWSTNGGAYGLALAPIQLSITGQLDKTRVRFL